MAPQEHSSHSTASISHGSTRPIVVAAHITPLAVSWLEEFLRESQELHLEVCSNLHLITLPKQWSMELYTNDVWLISTNDQCKRTFRWVISLNDLHSSSLDALLESDYLVITCPEQHVAEMQVIQEAIPDLYLAKEDPHGDRLYECPFRLLPTPYHTLCQWLVTLPFHGSFQRSDVSLCPKKSTRELPEPTSMHTAVRTEHFLEFYSVHASSEEHARSLISSNLVLPYYQESVAGDGTIHFDPVIDDQGKRDGTAQ
jgi:hypothetical protein